MAFSRARQLLILTAAGPVHPRFAGVWAALPRWDSIDRAALECQRFGAEGDEVPAPRVIPFLRRLDVWMRITRGRSGSRDSPAPQRHVRPAATRRWS